jgi:hypothetical protein
VRGQFSRLFESQEKFSPQQTTPQARNSRFGRLCIIYWSGKIEFVSLLPRSVSGRLSTADLQRHLFLNVGEVSMRPRPMSAVVALPPTVPHRCIIGREEAWRQRATVKRKKRRRMQLPVFGFGFGKHSRALQTLEVPKSWLAAR